MHLSEVRVEPGETVELGELLGLSGAPASGHQHLHFEIRQGDSWQRNAVHPLMFLPHGDAGPPDLVLHGVDFTDPDLPRVAITVTRPVAELDLLRVEAEVHDRDDDEILASQSYDMNAWNGAYAEPDYPADQLDYPYFNGVTVRPEEFTRVSDTYEVFFRFRRLPIEIPPERVRVVVRAIDVAGNVVEEQCHPCSPP